MPTELKVPPGAVSDKQSQELVRAWAANGAAMLVECECVARKYGGDRLGDFAERHRAPRRRCSLPNQEYGPEEHACADSVCV